MLARHLPAALLLLLLACPRAGAVDPPAKLELQPGDHIAIIGNTLADRMQHDGWLETLLQHRFPKHQLRIRNLSFPGDELNRRPRSENFGSPTQWLTKEQTDVVFAFFGYNESLSGAAGLDNFRRELAGFIDETLKQKYNGKAAPRLVLFSPIAHENLHSPHLPDGSENNARLALYTQAMAAVAAEKHVPFVDLFAPTQALYAQAKQPLTMNGVHLTPEGDRQLALVIDRALFGEPAVKDTAPLEKLRQAVVDKDFYWFSRYRTVDGYNVFGGRSSLAWHGQSNADVMKREMEIFDAMTANRDQRVWAVAQGGDLTVNDQNTPPLLEVKSNIAGPLPGGKFPFLGGQDAIAKMHVAKGMQVNLFASEEQFPELIKPVQMAVDTDGRLWAATWPTYPHWNPKEPMRDKLVILPDDDGDGKADRLIVFADQLNSVTGFEFWGGGVLVAAAPRSCFSRTPTATTGPTSKSACSKASRPKTPTTRPTRWSSAPTAGCTSRTASSTSTIAKRRPRRSAPPNRACSASTRGPSSSIFISPSGPTRMATCSTSGAFSSPATARAARATTSTSATAPTPPSPGIRSACGPFRPPAFCRAATFRRRTTATF